MKKYLFLLTILFIGGCQTTNNNILAEQIKNIKAIKIADFTKIDVYDHKDNSQLFDQKEEIDIFKEAFKYAKLKNEKKYKTNKFDYNIAFVLADQTERILHITKNEDNELILKYVGDSTDRYVIEEKHAEKLVELIFK